ncbi:MAG: hypothetical protein ACSHYF_04360 [Verrucomicrobiaceae bacterium]
MSKANNITWKRRIIIAALIIAGSIFVLFPAWLPNHPTLPNEESAVEGMQVILLLASAAFWFGAAKSAGRVAPFYRVMGFGGIAAAVGEADALAESILHIPSKLLVIPAGIIVLVMIFRARKQFPRFYLEFSTHPAAGFFASAFIMIYVLARFLGTPYLWSATLGVHYHPDIPRTVESYLELLACYLLFVGTIGLCLRERSHDPTAE